MKILKGYTKNLYRPEASIVERYIAEEAIEFCSKYIEKAKPNGLPESRHDDRVGGKGSRGLHVITPSVEDLLQVHSQICNTNKFNSTVHVNESSDTNQNPTKTKVLGLNLGRHNM